MEVRWVENQIIFFKNSVGYVGSGGGRVGFVGSGRGGGEEILQP